MKLLRLPTTTATAAALLLATTLPTTTNAQCPELLWSDEFDGTSLDDTKWTPMIGDGCDFGICGWGNNEWQQYTDSSQNIDVSDGTLKIKAQFNADTGEYTSARLRSLGKADFDMSKPLRLEARMKVPQDSQGLWPAFWMMPSQMDANLWPLGGEIDIMEFIGREPNASYGVMHYGENWNTKSQKGGPLQMPDHLGDTFHVFAVEKTPNAMGWYVDGYRFLYFTEEDVEPNFDWPFEEVFHFILNLAIGGNWPEDPDDTTKFPATLEVDYVRVYDLKTSAVRPLPRMDGTDLVHHNTKNVRYCVRVGALEANTDYDSYIEWSVPDGATFRLGADPTCIRVDFGETSGYVRASMYFTCGATESYSIPVEVQDYYETDFTLVGPNFDTDVAAYDTSTGIYAIVEPIDDTPAEVVYRRKLEEVYDHIHFDIIEPSAQMSQPQLYIEGASKFFMDAYSETAAPCTRIYIQLEDSSLATPDNYPIGRHSRYISFLKKDVDWQRLEFDFFDIPDRDTNIRVDRIVVLVDSFMQRSDTYRFRNLVSAKAGCNPDNNNCEPLSTNPCRMAAKSEEGACTDGFNNDGFGYNGDAPMDCEDSDCWNDPACLEGATPTPVTPAPVTPAPAAAPPNPTDTPAPVPVTTPRPTMRPSFLNSADEICNDGIDNDNSGKIDCEDEACAMAPECGSYWKPQCNAYDTCVLEGLVGDCCPSPLGEYKACCDGLVEKPASCTVHPACGVLGLEGDCCPSADGDFLDCCEPELCLSNPKCSGLDGACCPSAEGVFLECCEDRPETCEIHPACDALGLGGDCCPTPDGLFLDCCEARQCDANPACAALNLEDDCCPTQEGIFLECCNLDTPVFEGFTGRLAKSSLLAATPVKEGEPVSSASGQVGLWLGVFASTVILGWKLF